MRLKGSKNNKHICQFLETKSIYAFNRSDKNYRGCRHCALAIKTDDDYNRCPCCNRLFYMTIKSRYDKNPPEYECLNGKKYLHIRRDLRNMLINSQDK